MASPDVPERVRDELEDVPLDGSTPDLKTPQVNGRNVLSSFDTHDGSHSKLDGTADESVKLPDLGDPQPSEEHYAGGQQESRGSLPVKEAENDRMDETSSQTPARSGRELAESTSKPVESQASLSSPRSSTRARRSASIRRSRNASIALEHGSVNGAEARPAKLFIQNAFEKIKGSKDAKRLPALQQTTTRVLEQFTAHPDELPPAKMVLEPLRLVCVPPGTSNELKEVAIDTIGQMFALNYLGNSADEESEHRLLAEAVNIVCDAWEAEAAEQRVELQIIKALTAAVVNEDVVVHGPVLMRAVRQVYHIFVVTRSVPNQGLAQVSLSQMVQAVFDRVKRRCMAVSQSNISSSGDVTPASEPSPEADSSVLEDGTPALTLKDMQNTPLPDVDDSTTTWSELENITQDAGLLFRTLCRLSMKVIDENEGLQQPMRSKLLSLHLLHMILKHHISVFKDPNVMVRKSRRDTEPFVYFIKPYLRQALAQNALSQAPAAFEIAAEIFWLVLAYLRSEFKAELAVFFMDVYFTAMDMRTATMHQKLYFMTIIARICTDPRLLVELYLNYDCDPAAPNVFEKLMELVSRLALKPAVEPATPLARMSLDRQQIRVYDLNAPPGVAIGHLITSSQSSAPQKATDLEAFQLKMAALDSMVNVLRSLILWSQRGDQGGDPRPEIELGPGEPVKKVHQSRVASTSSASLASSDADDPDQFASRKQTKRALDAAVQEFNFNPTRGLRKFVEVGLLNDSENVGEVARLLLNTDGLDKAKLGEFLGKSSEFNQEVMVQFVDAMEFKGLTFVEALRQCLQRFRLPGEGQVVDRYMQTFARKYFQDNSIDGVHPDFASEDSAWVLAMSVMMLNTDLHSHALQKRRRMTDEQFIRNNKGMNDGVDFRAELLLDIYREIQANEIKLDSEQTQVAIRDEAYEVATDAITTRASQFFKSAPLDFADYYNASHAAHIRPMFELSWLAVLAGISNPFSQLHDHSALALCLEGLELALRIACHFDVAIARTSFVQTLSQSAALQHPARLRWKNVGAVKALLRVSLVEGDALRDSWYDVLVVVSQLEQLQIEGRSPPLVQPNDPMGPPPPEIKELLLSRDLVVDVDRVFANTNAMSNEGVVFFVKALARVSLEEIDQSRTAPEPRLFALQKMVDVCYYNMARIRMGWSELWDAAMAEQFAKVLVDSNVQVVAFALDLLRQLSMRFLEIDEMPHFAFQIKFLEPFVHALIHNSNTAIKVLVLECLAQMVVTRADKIKSGWAAIFGATEAAAAASASPGVDQSVLDSAYSLLAAVPTVPSPPPGYLDACSAMAKQPEARTALKSAQLMSRLIDTHPNDIALWQQVFVKLCEVAMRGRDLEVRGRCLDTLFDVLTARGKQFKRGDWDEVFTQSLGPLFNVLHGHTGQRSHRSSAHLEASQTNSAVGDTSTQLADNDSILGQSPVASRSSSPTRSSPMRHSPSKSTASLSLAGGGSAISLPPAETRRSRSRSPHRGQSRAREDFSLWMSSTLIQALKSLVTLFGQYFDMLEHALDSFFLELLRTCILQENDPVSRMGNSCLQRLVHDNAERFTSDHWHLIASKILQLFQETAAVDLMNGTFMDEPSASHADKFRSTIAKTVQTLLVIETVRDLLVNSNCVFNAIPVKEVLRLTTRLRISYLFAREFNRQYELRRELFQRGFTRQLPNLLMQESLAAQTYISISMRLFKAYQRFETDPSARQDLADELMPLCSDLLGDYNELLPQDSRHITKLMPIVESSLRHVSSFEDNDFRKYVPVIYLQVINILNKDMTKRLREEVQTILRRVADVWLDNNEKQLSG